MSDYVPQDILIQILTKLYVKSLVRFRCVSKSWCSLISDSNFISMHINYNKDNNASDYVLLLRHRLNSRKKRHYLLQYDETFDEYKQLNYPFKTNKHLNPFKTKKHFKIVGSCNGLLCLSNDTRSSNGIIILWNPSIRKYEILPKPNITYKKPGWFMSPIVFGFDPSTNDYKVVRIIYHGRRNESFQPEVELYEQSKGLWRSISVTVPAHLMNNYSTQTSMNGVVHWIALNNIPFDNNRCLIVLFNMINEEFSEMMLPDSLANDNVLSMYISAIGDSLWLLHDSFQATSSIWVMKEYGVRESWTKHFTIHLVEGLRRVVNLMTNGEVLLTTDYGELVLYDPKDQQIKYLRHGSQFFDIVAADIYQESLVLLNEGNGILTRPDTIAHKRLPALINRMLMWISCANNIGGSKKKR